MPFTPEEERLAHFRAYYQKNKASILKSQAKYKAKNREAYRKRESTPEAKARRRERYKKWAEKNREAIRASNKKYGERAKAKQRQEYNDIKVRFGCMNPSCGWSGTLHPHQLGFHHVDPTTKSECVSQIINSTNKMKEEIRKCVVLCSNCHRLVAKNIIDVSGLTPCDV